MLWLVEMDTINWLFVLGLFMLTIHLLGELSPDVLNLNVCKSYLQSQDRALFNFFSFDFIDWICNRTGFDLWFDVDRL